MAAHEYADLIYHVDHDLECVTYGPEAENVAVECLTCGEILLDFDRQA